MKKIALLALAAVALGCVQTAAFAQTCLQPTTIVSNGQFSGDTCAASGNETGVQKVCGAGNFTDKAAVFTWTRASASDPHTGNIAITTNQASPGYDIGVGIVRTTCGTAGVCVGLFDANSDGTSGETIDLTGAAFGPADTYYMFVSSFGDGSTGGTCGTFAGTVGTLPVKLQSFSID